MRLKIIAGFLLAFTALLRAQPNTLINDTFADGERLTQNLPDSLAWYTSAAARPNLAVRNGALTLVANDNDRPIWGYFPTVTLNIGDSLTASVDVSFTRVQPTGARFDLTLCWTNGLTPRRADMIPLGNYQGYGSFTNGGDATAGTRVRKRNGPGASLPNSALFELTNGPSNIVVWDTFGAARTGLAGVLQANTRYTVTLKITRTGADSASVNTSITGGSLGANNTLTEIDAASGLFEFDTLGIRPADTTNAGDALITRVELVHEVNTSRLINLSILTSIPGAGDSFTLGYIAGGAGTSGPKPLVVRAAGPSLGALGVAGTLDDPRMELFAGSMPAGQNDNWGGGAEVAAAMAAVGAFAFTGPTSRDAAVLANVTGGANNSVRVFANGNGTGTVIAEVYDATPAATFSASTPRLINVSVLKHLGTSLTVGFVVGGSGTKTVLVRAIGPTLGAAPFNVGGVVADPQLAVFSGSTQVAANDNWGGGAALSAAFTQVGAFTLPGNSRDAAVVTTLAPGSYTVQVNGVGGTTGVALVEVYEVQ
jgi:hypothetical protein